MDELNKLKERIEELTKWQFVKRPEIYHGHIGLYENSTRACHSPERAGFVIEGNRYESRFGISDQPKYWVFGALDLKTGEKKIIKTVFHEDFYVHIGILKIHCYRSPEKEARVLELVKGDQRFMQGYNLPDSKGNNVRIIDFIRGDSQSFSMYTI